LDRRKADEKLPFYPEKGGIPTSNRERRGVEYSSGKGKKIIKALVITIWEFNGWQKASQISN